ncbi:hypothetical protein QTO12_11760 [Vibrio owensii]|uniref:hypothetical protein n=1 Tax=Vibrio owensii TaxID=696485 RepID=UPI002F403277
MPHDFRLEEQEQDYAEEKESKIKKLVTKGKDDTDVRQKIHDKENHDPAKGPFLE